MPLLAIDKKTVNAVCMQHEPAAIPGQYLLLAAGIVFYKMVDGFEQMVKGGALKIVEVREYQTQYTAKRKLSEYVRLNNL